MANEYARQKGLTTFSVYQGQWSAAERDVEREILPMCNDQGMALIPYGVLGSGSFRTSAQRSAEQRQELRQAEVEGEQQKREGRNIAFTDKPQKTVMADALEKFAIARDTSITSVALAWARTKGPYIFPVIGGRKVEHLKDSIEALGLELTKEDVEAIEKVVPFDFGYPQTILGGPGGAVHPGDVWLTRRFGTFDWVSAPQVSQFMDFHGSYILFDDAILQTSLTFQSHQNSILTNYDRYYRRLNHYLNAK